MSERLDSKLRELVEVREAKDIAERTADEAKKRFKAIQADIYDELEEQGLKSIKVDLPEYGTVSFSCRETIYGRILDLDTALDAIDQACLSDELTKPGIQKRRLNEIVRERLENGQPLPEGVDFYANRGITISRSK